MSQDVEVKALEAFELKDEKRGEVVAVVATLGVVDRDGDVILPGAFASSKTAKISRYGHSMVLHRDEPVGKGKITEENGKAVFRGRYFMTTPGGAAAFNLVKELAEDTEWSFGFNQVKQGKMSAEWKAAGASRVIETLNAFEVSPCYLGAGVSTGTLAVKRVAGVKQPDPAWMDEAIRQTEHRSGVFRAEDLAKPDPGLQGRRCVEYAAKQFGLDPGDFEIKRYPTSAVPGTNGFTWRGSRTIYLADSAGPRTAFHEAIHLLRPDLSEYTVHKLASRWAAEAEKPVWPDVFTTTSSVERNATEWDYETR